MSTDDPTRDALEIEQIRQNIETQRAEHTRLTQQTRWCAWIIIGGAFVAATTLAFKAGELYATLAPLTSR